MTNAAYTTHGQFRPAGPQSPDQAGMPNTPVLALIALITPTALWMEFNLIGRIFAPELILIGLLPFLLLARGRMLMSPLPLDAFVAGELVTAPAMLKIDVQGFELEVLRGSVSLLAAFDYVYVEASFEALYEDQALFDDVAAFLKEQGFVEEGRYNVAHTAEGTPIQADFLFHRNHAVG